MNRRVLAGGAVLGGALLARRCRPGDVRSRFETIVGRMPNESPRKWLFRNISAIRENTERILKILEGDREAPAGPSSRTAA